MSTFVSPLNLGNWIPKNCFPKINAAFFGHVLLIATIMAVLGLMIIPVSTGLMDVLIVLDLVGTLTILIVAISIADPIFLYSFPSLLLITTLFRLGLNISSTRLILATGEAGDMIATFGHFVTGDNLCVGVVIFAVVQIVQFLVVAKGSERVAEVAARFTLDALPGKQMSIDADLRAGLITNEEARLKRSELIKESKFYGAMDGAMKFIKGEAIAGFAIIAINVIGGFVIGVFQRGLPLGKAAQVYTILTIGDGLAAQIPAFLLTMAAGFLVTRVSNPQDGDSLGGEIGRQIFDNPKPFFIVAGLLGILALVPGFPGSLLIGIAILLTGLAAIMTWEIRRSTATTASIRQYRVHEEETLTRLGQTFPLVLEMNPELYEKLLADPRWQECFNELYPRLRLHLARKTGIPFPELKIETNEALPANRYLIKVYELPVDEGFLSAEHFMIRNFGETHSLLELNTNEKTTETVHGTPVMLLELKRQAELNERGVKALAPEEVLLKHIARILKTHAKEFVGIQEVRNILTNVERDHPELVREVVPRMLSIHKLTDVLKRLVEEGVSINDFRLILETLSGTQPDAKDSVALTEQVRMGLKRSISHRYTRGKNKIAAFLLDPELEKMITDHIHKNGNECYLTLDPETLGRISTAITTAFHEHRTTGRETVLLTSIEIRRYVRKIIETEAPEVAVLSYQELEPNLIIDQRDVITLYHQNEHQQQGAEL